MRAVPKSAIGILIVAASAVCSRGASKSFTIEQVMSSPFASAAIASPTGAKVVWLLNERGHRNLWTASGPDWKGRKLTSFNEDDGQEIDQVVWAPDGTSLLFTRGGDFEMGRDNPNPAIVNSKPDQSIWSIALDGAPAKKMTEGNAPAISPKGDVVAFLKAGQINTMKLSGEGSASLTTQKGTISELRWAPDGGTLAFTSERGDHSFIDLYKFADKSLSYLDASVDADSEPVWSPDSTRVAFLRVPGRTRVISFGPQREAAPWSIRVAEVASGRTQQVFLASKGPGSVFHDVVAPHQILWTADDQIVFPWEKTGWCHLYTVSAKGALPIDLTPGEGEVEHVALSADARTIYYSANFQDIDRRHLWRVQPASKAAPVEVTSGDTIEWDPAPIADGTALVFLTADQRQKSHAAVRLVDGTVRALAPDAVPAEFPSNALVQPQQVILTAADGLPIHGQLFLPPAGTAARQHAALLFFHGGSRRQMLLGYHYMYYYSNAYSLNQYLASQGYVVLSVNYRSGIGYGLNFREALQYGATGASEFNDVVGAALYLRSRPDVDAKRIGLWGGSYGGYLTALGLARASDLFAAGVDFHGVHDWNDVIRNFSPTYDPQQQVEAAKLAFASSPLSSMQSWRSPVLLIHGDDDRNVPFSQTVRLVEALREQNVDFEQLIFPNEIHDFLLHHDWVKAYEATAEFFARKLHPDEAVISSR